VGLQGNNIEKFNVALETHKGPPYITLVRFIHNNVRAILMVALLQGSVGKVGEKFRAYCIPIKQKSLERN